MSYTSLDLFNIFAFIRLRSTDPFATRTSIQRRALGSKKTICLRGGLIGLSGTSGGTSVT